MIFVYFFFKSVKKIQASLISGKNKGTLHEDKRTLTIISRTALRMRNASDKICRENQNTRFTVNIFFHKNRPVHEVLWKNIVERGRQQIIIWRMRIACWITKATNTHSQYVILTAFQGQ